jgi:antitoxin Phd
MSTLTFRNKQGDLVDVPSIPATRLKNEFGTVFDRAMRDGAIAITRHDTPRAVLVSYEEFESLAKARSTTLEDHRAQFDAILDRMQTPAARKAMEAAFDATPAELGRAAAKVAARRRKLASKKGMIRARR